MGPESGSTTSLQCALLTIDRFFKKLHLQKAASLALSIPCRAGSGDGQKTVPTRCHHAVVPAPCHIVERAARAQLQRSSQLSATSLLTLRAAGALTAQDRPRGGSTGERRAGGLFS